VLGDATRCIVGLQCNVRGACGVGSSADGSTASAAAPDAAAHLQDVLEALGAHQQHAPAAGAATSTRSRSSSVASGSGGAGRTALDLAALEAGKAALPILASALADTIVMHQDRVEASWATHRSRDPSATAASAADDGGIGAAVDSPAMIPAVRMLLQAAASALLPDVSSGAAPSKTLADPICGALGEVGTAAVRKALQSDMLASAGGGSDSRSGSSIAIRGCALLLYEWALLGLRRPMHASGAAGESSAPTAGWSLPAVLPAPPAADAATGDASGSGGAVAHFARAIHWGQTLRRLGDTVTALGQIHMGALRDPVAAAACFARAVDAFDASGDRANARLSRCNVAQALVTMGRATAALASTALRASKLPGAQLPPPASAVDVAAFHRELRLVVQQTISCCGIAPVVCEAAPVVAGDATSGVVSASMLVPRRTMVKALLTALSAVDAPAGAASAPGPRAASSAGAAPASPPAAAAADKSVALDCLASTLLSVAVTLSQSTAEDPTAACVDLSDRSGVGAAGGSATAAAAAPGGTVDVCSTLLAACVRQSRSISSARAAAAAYQWAQHERRRLEHLPPTAGTECERDHIRGRLRAAVAAALDALVASMPQTANADLCLLIADDMVAFAAETADVELVRQIVGRAAVLGAAAGACSAAKAETAASLRRGLCMQLLRVLKVAGDGAGAAEARAAYRVAALADTPMPTAIAGAAGAIATLLENGVAPLAPAKPPGGGVIASLL